mmetsp:Transcript_108736/g.318122  ORF Transcript_108736/g.318122 Transcript_108736/m.318122 type:complete len:208 (+) Transcript_108736:295-918(+)
MGGAGIPPATRARSGHHQVPGLVRAACSGGWSGVLAAGRPSVEPGAQLPCHDMFRPLAAAGDCDDSEISCSTPEQLDRPLRAGARGRAVVPVGPDRPLFAHLHAAAVGLACRVDHRRRRAPCRGRGSPAPRGGVRPLAPTPPPSQPRGRRGAGGRRRAGRPRAWDPRRQGTPAAPAQLPAGRCPAAGQDVPCLAALSLRPRGCGPRR